MTESILRKAYAEIDQDRSYILICEFVEEQGMVELEDVENGEFYFGNPSTNCSFAYCFDNDGNLIVEAFMGRPSHAKTIEDDFRGNYEKIQYLNAFTQLDFMLRGLAHYRL